MAIIGIGTDVVQIPRFEKLIAKRQPSSLARIFTATELAGAVTLTQPQLYAAFLSKRFAAKEAVAKAVGTGIGGKLALTDISVITKDSGQPFIKLSDRGENLIQELFGDNVAIHLSLADDYPVATAFVTISKI
ncbi:MAG: holo-ACP synthase [Pseudomonadota bacterium]